MTFRHRAGVRPILRLAAWQSPVFLVNSRLGPFAAAPGAPRASRFTLGASLLPKLQDDYAEFLDHGCPDRLGMLFLPTCVGFGTGGVGAA